MLQSEIGIWADKTNAKQRGVDWQFKIDDARTKLKRLYPKIKSKDPRSKLRGFQEWSSNKLNCTF